MFFIRQFKRGLKQRSNPHFKKLKYFGNNMISVYEHISVLREQRRCSQRFICLVLIWKFMFI